VDADSAPLELTQDPPDPVPVRGVKGFEPTATYKVSMAYADGFKCVGEIAVSGPDARAKGETFAQLFWQKGGQDFAATETELFGFNAFHRSLGQATEANEIIVRLGARDADQKKLKRLAKLVPAMILSGPPGVTVLGGVPQIREIVSYWPALLAKELVTPSVARYTTKLEGVRAVTSTPTGNWAGSPSKKQVAAKAAGTGAGNVAGDVPLAEIALGRSGDKGDTANIGIIARTPKAYAWIVEHLTAQRVKDLFRELCHGQVVRFTLDKLQGVNFLLEESLGGGGTMTLRADAQGKTFAQGLLRQRFAIPADIVAECRAARGTEGGPR
jgi:hypothetical protein